jgi:hypothetical protein
MAKVSISNEPLTLDEVKKRLQLASDKDEHDEDVELMIVSVRQEAEKVCGPIINTTKTFYLDKFPGGQEMEWWDGVREGAISANEAREIELPAGNVQSVTSVSTYDEADASTEFSSANYIVDLERRRIVLRTGQVWPQVVRAAKGVEVVCVMGWATPADVPQDLKERMKQRCLQLWAERANPLEKRQMLDPWHYGTWVRLEFGRRNL